jgi:hypothetical protein
VQRPDKQWSVMLVNNDQANSHRVRVEFASGSSASGQFNGTVEESIFGSAQYHWDPGQHDFNAHLPESLNTPSQIYHGGKADPDGPIAHREVPGNGDFELPAASVVVLRGKL